MAKRIPSPSKKRKPAASSYEQNKPMRQLQSRPFEESEADPTMTQAEVDRVGFTAPDMAAGVAEQEKDALQAKADPEAENLETEIADKNQKLVEEENQVANEAEQDEEVQTKLADETEKTVEKQADAKETEEEAVKAENDLAQKQEQKVKEKN